MNASVPPSKKPLLDLDQEKRRFGGLVDEAFSDDNGGDPGQE
jgi:hypothetical protein